MTKTFHQLLTEERKIRRARWSAWLKEERAAKLRRQHECLAQISADRNVRSYEWIAELAAQHPTITAAARAADMHRDYLSRISRETGFKWSTSTGAAKPQEREKVSLRVSREEAARLAAVVRGLG